MERAADIVFRDQLLSEPITNVSLAQGAGSGNGRDLPGIITGQRLVHVAGPLQVRFRNLLVSLRQVLP